MNDSIMQYAASSSVSSQRLDLARKSERLNIQALKSTMDSGPDQLRIWASALGASGVAMGAFGAHALKKTLTERGSMDSWRTAVTYQIFHALALLVLSTWEMDHKSTVPFDASAKLFIGGTVLFSGSIYGLSLGGPRILGPVTPLGGLCLIGGWCALGFGSEGIGKK